MDRTDGAGNIGGLFVAEDPATSRPPTEITADWLNGVQEELLAAIEGAGVVPDSADLTQLHQAIQAASTGAVAIHTGGADPHPQYVTADEVAGLIPQTTGARLLRITRLSTPGTGTWTRQSDVGAILIRAIGAGGGGAAPNYGGGGGAGGFCERFISSPAASYPYSIGAGGASGSNGGNTTIAGMTAGGGLAGKGVNAGGNTGGTATGGDLNIPGNSGVGHGGSYGGGTAGGAGVYGGAGGGGGYSSGQNGGDAVFGAGGGGAGGGGVGGVGGAGYIEILEYAS